MTDTICLTRISAFLRRGATDREITREEIRFLEGWSWFTLLSYNGAVKKLLKFMKASRSPVFELPLPASDIYQVVL